MELLLWKAGASLFASCSLFHQLLLLSSDRLLFATTNHIEHLDPALSRPGRMDVWVNFTNATKWQAEGIFKYFFSSQPSASSSSSLNEASSIDASQKNPPESKRKVSTHAMPGVDEAEISRLTKCFADAIPEDEMNVCYSLFIHTYGVCSQA
jgi:mitochondrial chaperone BCS1